MKKLLILVLSIWLVGCTVPMPGVKQILPYDFSISKGKQGDGFQGVHVWRGNLKMYITIDSSCYVKNYGSKAYVDVKPIWKFGGLGEGNLLYSPSPRYNSIRTGVVPSTKYNHFWVGTFVHAKQQTFATYALEVKANTTFAVTFVKDVKAGKYYATFEYQGKTVNITEPLGEDYLTYLCYCYLGGQGESAVYAKNKMTGGILYTEP